MNLKINLLIQTPKKQGSLYSAMLSKLFQNVSLILYSWHLHWNSGEDSSPQNHLQWN